MDTNRFDRLTMAISRHVSRRSALHALTVALTGLVAASLGRQETAAAPYSVPLGGACYRDQQCRNDFIPTRRQQNRMLQAVHCLDNGFTYDGPFNCCRDTGGACYVDEHCCGVRSCVRQLCRFVKSRRRQRRHRHLHPHHHHHARG